MLNGLLIVLCACVGAMFVHFSGQELIGCLYGALIGVVLCLLFRAKISSEKSIWSVFEIKTIGKWIKNH